MERNIKKVIIFIFSALLFLSCAAHFGVYHRVKKNETLYSIAKLYGTSVDNLEKNNNIPDATKIQVGDYIFVPGVAAPLETGRKASAAPSNVKKEQQRNVKGSSGKSSPAKAHKKGYAPIKANPGKTGKFIWPAKGVVTSKFGPRWGRNHNGIDIGCPEGTPVLAAAAGEVIFVGEKTGFGLTVIISHPGNVFTIYGHNSKNIVRDRAHVKQGEKIALSGQTGEGVTGPHLHFEIRIEAKPIDPLTKLPKTVP